jgi:hypothetical protein
MAEVKPLFESNFNLEPGKYLFRVKKAEAQDYNIIKNKDGNAFKDKLGNVKQGVRYRIEAQVESGEFEGLKHWESFESRSKNGFSARRLFGFLIKLGVIPAKESYDDSVLEEMGFMKSFEEKCAEKLYGAKVESKNNFTQSTAYYSVNEFLNDSKGLEKKPVAVDSNWS